MAASLIVPEVFASSTACALPELLRAVSGPRVALFHDALPLQFPEFAAPATVARFPAYLCELQRFDGIVAVSAASRDTLLGYWAWLGASAVPPVVVLPHGIDPPRHCGADPRPSPTPVVLCVGSIEPRKNHDALLAACDQLWSAGEHFELHLVGLTSATYGGVVRHRIQQLQAAGRPIRYDGPVTDDHLEAAYARCSFTIYPSLAEGFGLPVAESLARGKPCVCSGRGAIGEVARGGGCMELDRLDAPALAVALRQLLHDPTQRSALAVAAAGRRFRTWGQYVVELQAWLTGLPRR